MRLSPKAPPGFPAVGERVGNVIYLIDRGIAGQVAGTIGLGALAFAGLMQLVLGWPMDTFNLIAAMVILIAGAIGSFACWRSGRRLRGMPAAQFTRGYALDLDKRKIVQLSTRQVWVSFADARTVSYVWAGDGSASYMHWNTHIVGKGQHVLVSNRDKDDEGEWVIADALERIGIAAAVAPGSTNYWHFRRTYRPR